MSRLARLAVLMSLLALTGCRLHPETRLGQAVFTGEVRAVRSLVATTPADSPDGPFTPLMLAARAGHIEVLAALLDAGADVNRRDTANGWTPLMHALHKRQHHAARVLLARGADAGTGPGGTSALEMAALDDDAAMIRLLLPAGATRPQITGHLPSPSRAACWPISTGRCSAAVMPKPSGRSSTLKGPS